MKFTIEKQDLLKLANTAVSVVANRNTIPILGNVVLIADGAKLKAIASDLDRQVETKVDANVTEPGDTTVDAKLLAEIAKNVKDGSLIEAHTDDSYLHIKAGRAKYKLATLPSDDFPRMSDAYYSAEIELDADEFETILKKTVWAASNEETRYYLNGVALQSTDSGAVAVATDGHRLARFNFTANATWDSVIIPSKTVHEFIKIASSGAVRLSICSTKVRMECGDTVITSKVIDGTYPEWQRVLPKGNDNKITANSVEMCEAISRVSLVSSERTRAVKLDVSGDELNIMVQGHDGGEAMETVDVQKSGEDVTIGLNSKYGLDALKLADKGDVTLRYKDPMSPVLIEYASYPDMIAVLMPMRI